MTLLEVTAERVFGLVLIGGVSLAVVIYIIRKQLRNRQNDPVKVIGLWVLSFVLFLGIAYSAVAAREGIPLLFVLLVSLPIAVTRWLMKARLMDRHGPRGSGGNTSMQLRLSKPSWNSTPATSMG